MNNNKHKAGILMPISSLPNKYGIGSFGKNAKKFVDFLKRSKQAYWQILPLGQTSFKDSPYQSISIYAGNPYFIDLDILYKEKLLSKKELNSAIHQTDEIDYKWLFENRYSILKQAYKNFIKNEEYYEFINNNQWVKDYGFYMVLKEENNYKSWNLWNKEHRNYELIKDKYNEYEDKISFWIFIQYEFFKQYKQLKEYANKNNIEIIGDMPIYVAYDSVEVWKDKNNFLLDEDYNPTVVAGCPPDTFSDSGQLWGNPIYNYPHMQEDNFSWWVDRMKFNLELYDIVRIDHFRGFAGYYEIAFNETTAINGTWKKGYGDKIFEEIDKHIPKTRVIAEDLGYIDQPVIDLIKKFNYPGMKVLQFAFEEDDSKYLPRMYEDDNCIVYTGTHDSDCSKSWFEKLNDDARQRYKKEVIIDKDDSDVTSLIKLAMNSIANYAIIPLQDYLELTNEEGRINTPSIGDGNWKWIIKEEVINKELSDKIKKITKECNRD